MISLYPCWRCVGETYNIRCSIEYIRLNHFKYRLILKYLYNNFLLYRDSTTFIAYYLSLREVNEPFLNEYK